MKTLLAGFALAFLALMAPAAAQAPKTDPANTLIIELKSGKVVIELLPKLAPKHVARVKTLAAQGFYNGIVFHRVIEGFMAQTGDPTGTGTGGSKLGNIPAEFTPTPFERGTIGAARSSNPDSADSQFFICFTQTPFLNGKYTVWGRVVSGMQYVDAIKKGAPGSGTVTDPDKMLKVYIQKDGPKT